MLETFIQVVESLRGNLWAPLVFVAAFSVACHGLPTTLFPVAGGILFGFWGGTFCNVLGFAVGSSVTFFLARRWGRNLALRLLKNRPAPAVFQRPGFWLLLVVRLTGFPPLLMANLLAGISEMPYRTFLAATLPGVLPWSAVMAFFAQVLWEALRAGGMAGFKSTLTAHARPLLVLVGVFVLLVGAAAWFGRRLLPPPQEGSVKE